jgi:integrase
VNHCVSISGWVPTLGVDIPFSTGESFGVWGQGCPQVSPFLLAETQTHSRKVGVDYRPESVVKQKEDSLARRRFQEGSLTLRGTRNPKWHGRWLEDVLLPDGSTNRIHRSAIVGTKKDFPTKKLAQRELRRLIEASGVNGLDYKPKPTATFSEFAERWKRDIMSKHARSTQAAEKADLKAWDKIIGQLPIREISEELLQRIITTWETASGDDAVGAKTIKNRVGTLRLVMKKAKKWGYVSTNPALDLELPTWDKPEQPHFSVEDVRNIIKESDPPYNLVWWLIFETHIRRGEVCALDVGHIDLNNCIITVRRSCWGSVLKNTKSKKARKFSFSPELAMALRPLIEGRKPDDPLFLSPEGRRLNPDNFVKRALKPVLEKLGLEGGTHAFRHGAATLMDELNVPMKVRQSRLGHVDPETTLNYSHIVGEDDRKLAASIGKLFAQVYASCANAAA